MTTVSAPPAIDASTYDTHDARSIVRAYHERTKHHLERYARGPETLDWSSPPNPFRDFIGAPRVALPLGSRTCMRPYSALAAGLHNPVKPTLQAIGSLFELSFALSAWKEHGPDRWAVRCNPSSGNLHPTEAYLFVRGIEGLQNGLYHYDPHEHALELRCAYKHSGAQNPDTPALHVGLTSIHWREAWKYGERAFRYCQLDMGHALGALRYAAATLGWSMRPIDELSSAGIAERLGLHRREDFLSVETEEPESIIQLICEQPAAESVGASAPLVPDGDWLGRANRLDDHPMYAWPVIDEVAVASRVPRLHRNIGRSSPGFRVSEPLIPSHCATPAADVIRERRSAQAFDRKHVMSASQLWRMLDTLLPRDNAVPWDAWGPNTQSDAMSPRVHVVLFVHRVDGLPPGLYAMPRSPRGLSLMRQTLDPHFDWATAKLCPPHIPLYRLADASAAQVARKLSCGQAIASDCCVAWGLLAEFDDAIDNGAWAYRHLHREAGLLGQVLYLEAEAAGLRGTGIGCFYDDACHQALGLTGTRLQTIYHFSLGRPLIDTRIQSLPPYPGKEPTP